MDGLDYGFDFDYSYGFDFDYGYGYGYDNRKGPLKQSDLLNV